MKEDPECDPQMAPDGSILSKAQRRAVLAIQMSEVMVVDGSMYLAAAGYPVRCCFPKRTLYALKERGVVVERSIGEGDFLYRLTPEWAAWAVNTAYGEAVVE